MPNSEMACEAYREQDGSYRQRGGSAGEMKRA
jgi:hypothetical protein